MSQIIQSSEDFFISAEALQGHCLGVASAGGGKSNFFNLMVKQQVMRGGGVLFLDGKNTQESVADFLNLARQHNRWHDTRVVNIGDPAFSNTYNPLANGDADDITRRLMHLQGQGDEISLGRTSRGLRAIIGVLKTLGEPFNFGDLACLMSDPAALANLIKNSPQDLQEVQDLATFATDVSEPDEWGQPTISSEKLRHTFEGIYSQVHALQVGGVGQVLSPQQAEVDLKSAIEESELVYVSLPLLGKEELAESLGRLIISELRAVVGCLQKESRKVKPPFLVIMDDFAAYARPSFSMLFEQASSAGVCLLPFIQNMGDLKDEKKGLDADFAAKIMVNTRSKIVFNLQDIETCEKMSQVAQDMFHLSDYDEISAPGPVDLLDSPMPKDFGALEVGEAFFMERKKVTKIQLPFLVIEPDGEDMSFPKFDISANSAISKEEGE